MVRWKIHASAVFLQNFLLLLSYLQRVWMDEIVS